MQTVFSLGQYYDRLHNVGLRGKLTGMQQAFV